MVLRRLTAATTVFLAFTGAAQAFERVTSVDSFNALMSGKELRLGIYGLALSVTPDGQIRGRAVGSDVTGSWSWQNGYFCREMDWGGTEIPYNCQLVEAGDGKMRFTTDQGAGDDATFNLR